MPGITKPERKPHPASQYVKISLDHPGGFQVARRRAVGGVSRPILPKRLWKQIPNWIALYAERGVAKKCWDGCALLPATHDGRRYGGCQIRGCTNKPQPGAPIHACQKCRWSVCEKCADRPRMPMLAQDPLFHGPDDPCMLMYPQYDNMVGRGTVIVCPGGNYEFLSPLEGLPVVEWLSQHGIGAVVLRYRLLPDYCLDDCLDDLEAAAARIRSLRPGPVAALGFSAGGHLIASLGLRAAKRKQPQPLDAQVLVYPGIDGRDWHSPEYNGFFNKGKWRIPKRAQSLHEYQDDLLGGGGFAAPPTCLVGSTEDTCTPNEQHTDVFHAALEERDIPNVYLRDAFGEHGFELKGGWTPGCVKWLHSRGFGSHPQLPGVHKMSLRRPAPRASLSDATETNQLPASQPEMMRKADSDEHVMGSLVAGENSENSPRFPPPPIEAPPIEDHSMDSRVRDMAAAQHIARAMSLSAVTDTDSLWACTPAPQQEMRGMAKFGKELGVHHLPRGMPSSSLPSSATTIASTATATSSMLPPRLSSNASSFSSVDTILGGLGGRSLGGHSTASTFDLPPTSSGGMRPPRESKRKASQLGGVDTASFSAVPVQRKENASYASSHGHDGSSHGEGSSGSSLAGLSGGRLPMGGEPSLLPLLKGGNAAKQAAPTPRATPKAMTPKATSKQQPPPPGGSAAGSTSYAARGECNDDPSMIEL